MWETQHNIADEGLFQDSDFAGDLEDSKSTSGGILCIFGSRTFVPISRMCKRQTSVAHSSTEAEIISLDAGLRMDGIPALDLWDSVVEVFRSSPNQTNKNQRCKRATGKPVGSSSITNAQQIPTANTNHQLADILTKGNFTRDELNNLLHLFNISHLSYTCCAKNSSLISCSKTMAKRMQERKGEKRSVAKSKSTATNLSSHVPTSSSSAKSPIAS